MTDDDEARDRRCQRCRRPLTDRERFICDRCMIELVDETACNS